MSHKLNTRIWVAILVMFSIQNVFSDEEKAEGRQLFGGAGNLGPLLSGNQFLGQLGQYIQQGLGQYQQVGAPPQHPQQLYQQGPPPGSTSITEALTSIAKYDDLKCVPRLLCEVAAGGRPGYASGSRQAGGIPFINKDALMSLLTVFNFGDTSPLMAFGRSILLGITAKGDPNTCFSAYPLCPRDPDNLVDYLNNHKGGFFKFFGSQRPYYPSKPYGRIQNGAHRTESPPGRPQDVPNQRPNRGPKQLQFPNVYPPPMTQNVNAFRDPDYFRKEKLSLLFPNNENVEETPESNFFNNKDLANSATTFYFPNNVNNEASNTYYVNEQSTDIPVNTFYFPGHVNKRQPLDSNLYNKIQSLPFDSNLYNKIQSSPFDSNLYNKIQSSPLDSNLYNKIQSPHSPGKTLFFPNNNEQLTDSNFFYDRERVKSLYFPTNENTIYTSRPLRSPEDIKKQTSPMTFPDQNGNDEFRFDSTKINRQAVNRPVTNFSGLQKPNFTFGYGRNQIPNLVNNSVKREKRNKREETSLPTNEIPPNHKPNMDEYEIIEDNEESVKYSTDDSDVFGNED